MQLIALLIFTAPLNLFLALSKNQAYINGLLVDYLIPKLYLVDIVIVTMILWWTRPWLKGKTAAELITRTTKLITKDELLFFFVAVLLSVQFLSANLLASWWYILTLVKVVAVLLVIKSWSNKFKPNQLVTAFCASIFFQALLGWYQFLQQQSLFPYQVLGETDLSQPFGLARAVVNGGVMVIPYGTTPHPNILAGAVTIYGLTAFSLGQKHKLPTNLVWLVYLSLAASFSIILLTQSWSAALTFLIGLTILARKGTLRKIKSYQKLPNLILTGTIAAVILIAVGSSKLNSQSFTRRQILNSAAWEMFLGNPIYGVGLNNFTVRVEEYSYSREIVRFVQPAHHLGLLWLAETGLVGLGLTMTLLWWLKKKHLQEYKQLMVSGLILLPIIVFDHYILTQQIGMILFVLFFSLAMDSEKETDLTKG